MAGQRQRGARVGGFIVLGPVHAGEHEVWQARRRDGLVVALKVGNAALDHEARALEHLEGCAAARLIGRAEIDDRPYLALEWCAGVDARWAAGKVRQTASRQQLLVLCRNLVRAYAGVHGGGIVHGHVHPRHVLIDGRAVVRIIDFSRSWWIDEAGDASYARPAIGPLSEPERAVIPPGTDPPPPTPRGEQYSLAALMYLLVTGKLYCRFARERGALARQIVEQTPLPFADVGAEPWPGVERVLAKALSKDPDERFGSVAQFEHELEALRKASPRTAARPPRTLVQAPLGELLDAFLRGTAIDDPSGPHALPPPPRCSVNYGAAGMAFAHYRLARIQDNDERLTVARAWLDAGVRAATGEGAFYTRIDDFEITPDTVGRVSPYHTPSGLHCVGALIAAAHGDGVAQQAATESFIDTTSLPCANPDITLGRSAVLLASAFLHAVSADGWASTHRLRDHGDRICAELWRKPARIGPGFLGIAHGWAGILYATLQWARTRSASSPESAIAVLDELAARAEPYGHGLRWPRAGDLEATDPDPYWAGWCHGTAGYVFLWTLAYELLDDERFLRLAEGAAWHTLDHDVGETSLCCGAAGQCYALLNLYRHTGDDAWLLRAAAMANSSASTVRLAGEATSPFGLYKGHAGLALLAADLQRPERAAMPLFEPEPDPEH